MINFYHVLLISQLLIPGFFSFFLTKQITKIAIKYRLYDLPKTDRFHTEPTPLLGGVAIFFSSVLFLIIYNKIYYLTGFFILVSSIISFYFIIKKERKLFIIFSILSILTCFIVLSFIETNNNIMMSKLSWIMLGGQLLFLVGIYDDILSPVKPFFKLFIQIMAALIIIFKVDMITFLGIPLNFIVTLLWIIGIINSFNLIDNMNGLSSGVAAISLLFLGFISLYSGNFLYLGPFGFIIFSVLIGFLPNNFPRAKIFMGDGGSLFLGYILGAFGIIGSWKTSNFSISIIIPVLVLSYPIFDVILVVINRIKAGKPIYLGGKDHSSHRLVKLGLKPADAVFFIYFFVFYTGFSAYFLTMIEFRQAIKMLIFIVAILIIFGIRLSRIETD